MGRGRHSIAAGVLIVGTSLAVGGPAGGAPPSGGALPAPLTLEIGVAGAHGVPDDAVAVAVNLTAASPVAAGFITVFSCTPTVPTASNLNFPAGRDVANAAIVALSADGSICVRTSATSDVIVDVTGYVPATSLLQLLPDPQRALDTRSGIGAPAGPVPADGLVELDLGAVVPVGTTTVVLNATAVGPEANGFATLFPCDQGRPATSTLNYRAGRDVPNLVISRVSPTRKVCVHTTARAHLLVDVTGFLADPDAEVTTIANPERIVDTRVGLGGPATPVGTASRTITIHGVAGIPSTATMALVNVTSTRTTADGFATVAPCGGPPPQVSTLNWAAGVDVANAALVPIGSGGAICATASTPTDLVLDVTGYVEGDLDLAPVPPARVYDSRTEAQPRCGLVVGGSLTGVGYDVWDVRSAGVRTTVSWPGNVSWTGAAIAPGCDAVLSVRNHQTGVPAELVRYGFDGSVGVVATGVQGTLVQVTDDGTIYVVGSTTVENITDDWSLPLLGFPSNARPVAVLDAGVVVHQLWSTGGRGRLRYTSLDGDPLGEVELPAVAGAGFDEKVELSPSGALMVLRTIDPARPAPTTRATVLTLDGTVLATEPAGEPAVGGMTWLAEGVVVLCKGAPSVWSIYSNATVSARTSTCVAAG